MPTEIRLHEAYEAIVAACAATCDAARADGLLLDGIRSVTVGDKARTRPQPPYLWVAVGAAVQQEARAIHETWTVSVMLNVFVASESPEDGWMEAMTWAAKASSVVLTDRKLGLDYVTDVRRRSLEPIGQLRENRRFGAFARLDMTAHIVEPSPAP